MMILLLSFNYKHYHIMCLHIGREHVVVVWFCASSLFLFPCFLDQIVPKIPSSSIPLSNPEPFIFVNGCGTGEPCAIYSKRFLKRRLMWCDAIQPCSSSSGKIREKGRRRTRSCTLGTLWHVLPFLFFAHASDISKRKSTRSEGKASEIRGLGKRENFSKSNSSAQKNGERQNETTILSYQREPGHNGAKCSYQTGPGYFYQFSVSL